MAVVINNRDVIGNSGEGVVFSLFNHYSQFNQTKCEVAFLGAKWPVIDMYIQFNRNAKTYYFFLQVKSTALGPQGTGTSKVLEIKLKKTGHMKMAAITGPTYLIGVDCSGGALGRTDVETKVYIYTVKEKVKQGVYSIPVSSKHELTMAKISLLLDEVADYWKQTPSQKGIYKSNFE